MLTAAPVTPYSACSAGLQVQADPAHVGVLGHSTWPCSVDWWSCSHPFSGCLLWCRYEQQVKRAEMFSKLVSNVSGKLDAAHTIDRGHITTITEADETSSPHQVDVNLATAETAAVQTAQQAPGGVSLCPPGKLWHTCMQLSQQLTPQQAQACLEMHCLSAALARASIWAGAPIVDFLSLVYRVAAAGTASTQPAQEALAAGPQAIIRAVNGALHSCKLGACTGSCLGSCSSDHLCPFTSPRSAISLQHIACHSHCLSGPSQLFFSVSSVGACAQRCTVSVFLCCIEPGCFSPSTVLCRWTSAAKGAGVVSNGAKEGQPARLQAE